MVLLVQQEYAARVVCPSPHLAGSSTKCWLQSVKLHGSPQTVHSNRRNNVIRKFHPRLINELSLLYSPFVFLCLFLLNTQPPQNTILFRGSSLTHSLPFSSPDLQTVPRFSYALDIICLTNQKLEFVVLATDITVSVCCILSRTFVVVECGDYSSLS